MALPSSSQAPLLDLRSYGFPRRLLEQLLAQQLVVHEVPLRLAMARARGSSCRNRLPLHACLLNRLYSPIPRPGHPRVLRRALRALSRRAPSTKRLQLTAARLGCRSGIHGRRPPRPVLDSRAAAGRHSVVYGAAAAEPRSVGRREDAATMTLEDLGNLGDFVGAIGV